MSEELKPVVIFLNENYWAERLRDIPQVLRAKELDKLNKQFASEGFPATNGAEDWISVSTAGQSLQSTIGFLERCGAAAVTVEPSDVVHLLGKNVGALALRRGIEMNGAEAYELELIEPSELADNLTKAAWAVSNHTATPDTDPYSTPELDAAFAEDDLREHGLLTDDMQAAHENFYRDKSKDPDIVYGRDSFGNLSEPDLSDFFPNGSHDPWGL
jgi:hypothetical protein